MGAGVVKAGLVRLHADLPVGAAAGVRTVDDLRAHRQAELDQAYAAGFAAGREAAELEGAAAVPRLVRSVDDAVAAVRSEIAERAHRDLGELCETAFEIACWLVQREVAVDAGALAARLGPVLDDLIPTAPVVLQVAPELVDRMAGWASELGVEVQGRAGLRAGEATIEAGHAGADLTFADARRRLLEALGPTGDPDGGATP